MLTPRRRRFTLALAGACLLAVTTAQAAGTPEQKCQAAKNKIAGTYAACRQNAEAKLATSGGTPKYDDTLTKCGTKFTSAWQKAIAKAAKVNATCLDAPLTKGDFQTILAESTDNIADALAGLGLTDCTADLATCAGDLGTCTGDLGTCTTGLTQATSDLGTCNASLGTCTTNLATCQAAPQGQRLKTGQTTCWDRLDITPPIATLPCAGTGQDGELQKGLARAYTDNLDGTITDKKTGLMWEKLSDDGTIHDKDSIYTWANTFAVKVAGLNGGGGFAGHTDWRMPNVNELLSLVSYGTADPSVNETFDTACAAACTVTMCSCTQSGIYWSATSYQSDPSGAWVVGFIVGSVSAYYKDSTFHVRGVRGGS